MISKVTTVTNLAHQLEGVMKVGRPHGNWPQIGQLPGEVWSPNDRQHKANFVAYQVRVSFMCTHFCSNCLNFSHHPPKKDCNTM